MGKMGKKWEMCGKNWENWGKTGKMGKMGKMEKNSKQFFNPLTYFVPKLC